MKKNERITNVLELQECKARSNSVSEGSKYLLTPTSYDVSVKSKFCHLHHIFFLYIVPIRKYESITHM